MRIKKTLFTKEIEISIDEIKGIERDIYPAADLFKWIIEFLKSF